MVNNDGFDDDDAGCIDKDHDCQCTVAVCPPESSHCTKEETHSPTDGAAASKYCGGNTADSSSVSGLPIH